MSAKVAVGLGSNLGDRTTLLAEAVERLSQLGSAVELSPIYSTEPIGPPQADYLNMVVVFETDRSPQDLMAGLLAIERAMGRERRERWGPRAIDLDLLLYGDQGVEEPGLTVPHPRMLERRFVLEPLLDVWPNARLPDGRPVADFLPQVQAQRVDLFDRPAPWPSDEIVIHWPTARMRFRARGGWYVVAQMALFVLVAGAAAVFPNVPSHWGGWSRPLGGAMIGAGTVLGIAGWLSLGTSLSPLPAPRSGARFTDRGVYGLVRHPIYGAVMMGFPGLAIWRSSLPALALSLGLIPLHTYKARLEERLLLDTYPEYGGYMEKARRRFIPWVW